MTQELKPCPFCGSKAEVSVMDTGYAYVWCSADEDACEFRPETFAHPSESEAAAIWNRRAPQPEEGASHAGPDAPDSR